MRAKESLTTPPAAVFEPTRPLLGVGWLSLSLSLVTQKDFQNLQKGFETVTETKRLRPWKKGPKTEVPTETKTKQETEAQVEAETKRGAREPRKETKQAGV